jgi:hypothetical protein
MQTKPQIWADPDYDPASDPLMQPQPNASPFVVPPDGAAAPSLPRISMPGAPPVFAPGPAPEVSRIPTPIETQIGETSGRLQDLQKHDNYDFSQHSKLRNVGHVLSKIGNVAGDIFAPATMANVPGTDLNRQVQEGSLSSRLQQLTQQQSEDEARGAATDKTKAETAALPLETTDKHALSAATTSNVQSETQARLHPHAKNEFELWLQQNPNGTAQQFEQLQKQPLSQEDADSRNGVWDTIADKYHLPKGQFRAGMSGADAAALASAMNQVVGRDQGGTKITIQQQTADNAGAKSRDAATEKEYTAASKDLGSQFSTAQTQAETLAQASQELQSGAVGQAVGTIKTLVGLAGGKGTGVRITQAELNALAQARGLGGDFEGYINKLSGKGALSTEQKAGMVQLLGDVENTIRGKMAKQDQYLDKLASARSTQEIRQIQSDYRKDLLGSGKSGGGAAAEPARPEHVPANYKFDKNGPKGPGWYKP